MEQINVQQQSEEPLTQPETDRNNDQSETLAKSLSENGGSQNFIRTPDEPTASVESATEPPAADTQPENVVASASVLIEDSAVEIPIQSEPQPIELPIAEAASASAFEVALPETPIQETPTLPTLPAPKLVMPELYVQASGLRTKGVMPKDDLLIEVILPEKEPSRFRVWFTEIRALMRDFLFAAATALLIVVFVIQPVKVEGTSMLPRLHDGERIFVNKFIYQFETIKHGDIVVFWYPKNPSQSFIKRVIGLPGDEVRVTNGKLYINNKLYPEPYLAPEYTAQVMPNRYWIVEDHHYFVMGDNRDASNDSRSWGQVPEKYIYGKAVFRYWPVDRFGSLTDGNITGAQSDKGDAQPGDTENEE